MDDKAAFGKSDIVGVVKTTKPEGFIYCSNEGFLEATMTYEARGLLAYLLSHGAAWEIMLTDLINKSPAGRDAVRDIIRELARFGYMRTVRQRSSDGRWVYQHQVFDNPFLNPDYDPTKPFGGFIGNSAQEGRKKPKHKREQIEKPFSQSPLTPLPLTEIPSTVKPQTVKPGAAEPLTVIPPFINNKGDQKQLTKNNEDQQTKPITQKSGGDVLTGIRAEVYQELLTLCGDDERIDLMHQLLDYCTEITLWPVPPVRRKSQLNDMIVNWWHPLVSLLAGVDWNVERGKEVFRGALEYCTTANLSPSRPAGLNGSVARILRGDVTAVAPLSQPKPATPTKGQSALAELRRKNA